MLESGEQKLIGLGFLVAIPKGHEGQIRPRSSVVLDHKVTVPNSPGTIDAGYREEVGVILYNYGTQASLISPGDRIAQLVVSKVEMAGVIETEITGKGRGGGFGSTNE